MLHTPVLVRFRSRDLHRTGLTPHLPTEYARQVLEFKDPHCRPLQSPHATVLVAIANPVKPYLAVAQGTNKMSHRHHLLQHDADVIFRSQVYRDSFRARRHATLTAQGSTQPRFRSSPTSLQPLCDQRVLGLYRSLRLMHS